jgi:hypothetical protein
MFHVSMAISSRILLKVSPRQVPLFTFWDDPKMQEKERDVEKAGSEKCHPKPGVLQADSFRKKSLADPAPILSNV